MPKLPAWPVHFIVPGMAGLYTLHPKVTAQHIKILSRIIGARTQSRAAIMLAAECMFYKAACVKADEPPTADVADRIIRICREPIAELQKLNEPRQTGYDTPVIDRAAVLALMAHCRAEYIGSRSLYVGLWMPVAAMNPAEAAFNVLVRQLRTKIQQTAARTS